MEPLEGLPEAERTAKREEMEWAWAEEDKNDRDSMHAVIDANGRKLREELRNRKAERERLAFTLPRFSPVASFQLAAMNLAGTDIGLKPRYEDALEAYRTGLQPVQGAEAEGIGLLGRHLRLPRWTPSAASRSTSGAKWRSTSPACRNSPPPVHRSPNPSPPPPSISV